jgi:sirohydrochlorin cobaltochelatase
MNRADFCNAALVLLGHGSMKNADSAASVYQHAAELHRRKIFAEVREAFWKQDPQVKQVLPAITAPRVFIVPMFISEGYFSDEVIPRELGFQASHITLVAPKHSEGGHHASQTIFYCAAIGTHDSMTNVLLARAREVMAKFPFPRLPRPKDTTLIIAGHGTEKNENSRKAIERQVELIRALNEFAGVHAVFMEEDPRIVACYELAQTKNIIVVPFFISDGMHTQEDIPVMLGEPERIVKQRLDAGQPTWRNPTEKNGKLVWYSPSVGSDPHVADVILERVREAAK